MTIEMKSFAISTLDDIAEGFFHARISDLPESKQCWQEIRKIRLSAAERSGRQQAANAAKQSPAEKAEKEGGQKYRFIYKTLSSVLPVFYWGFYFCR